MSGYDDLLNSFASIELPGVALLELSGADAIDWLQGQVTQDVRPLRDGAAVSMCFCTPTGQMLAVVDAFAVGDIVLLSMPRECVGSVLGRVEQMVVMEDVEARELDLHLVCVQGVRASECELEATYRLANDRTGFGGFDLWLSGAIDLPVPVLSAGAFNVARLEAGIPIWGIDMTGKTMPPEMGPAFESRHVSYRKGCYVGQEVLMRIYSRGHTNRTWVGLALEGDVEAGAAVEYADRADAGTVTSSAQSPSLGWIAGAIVRNEASAPGTRVVVRSEQGPVVAEVISLPFRA